MVKVQCPYATVTATEREGEHRGQAGFHGPGDKIREPEFGAQIGYRNGHPAVVGGQARSLGELDLQFLEAHGGVVRGRYVVGLEAR